MVCLFNSIVGLLKNKFGCRLRKTSMQIGAVPQLVVKEQFVAVERAFPHNPIECIRYRNRIVHHPKGIDQGVEFEFFKLGSYRLGKARTHEKHRVCVIHFKSRSGYFHLCSKAICHDFGSHNFSSNSARTSYSKFDCKLKLNIKKTSKTENLQYVRGFQCFCNLIFTII